VLDSLGAPVADALITADKVERVISDVKGSFCLPLRWQPMNAAIVVTVDHPRSGRKAVANFQLPDDLTGNKDIKIT
jgi:hypothetical protein